MIASSFDAKFGANPPSSPTAVFKPFEFNTDFKAQIRYSPKELTLKDVYFFLATPINNDSTPVDEHDDEVGAFEWCNYEDALFKITYDSDRSVIKKADRYIKKHNLIE